MPLAPDATSTCRILSIDGGGIRGVIPGQILQTLEKKLGRPLAECFHLITGTSTGAILATGLARGMSGADLLDFYFRDGSEIFNPAFFGSLGGPKYSPAPLEAILQKTFGDAKLSDLTRDLLVPAYDIQSRGDVLFESWRARGIQEPDPRSSDFLLRDVLRATSAAPTYFPPALATARNGRVYPCIDGGMFANSPALLGLVAARRLMPLAKRFLVVSIGTGELSKPLPYKDAADWGLIGWGPNLLDVMFTAMGATVAYELDQLAPLVDQIRFQSSLEGASEDLDNATPQNLLALRVCADRALEEQNADVDRLVEELRTPLPDKLPFGYPSQADPPRPSQLSDFDVQKIAENAKAALGKGDWCAQAEILASLGHTLEAKALAPLCAAQKLAQGSAPPLPPAPAAVSLLRGVAIGAALGLFTLGPVGAALGAILGMAGARPDVSNSK